MSLPVPICFIFGVHTLDPVGICVWDSMSSLICIWQIQAYHDLWCLNLEGDNTVNVYAGDEDDTIPGGKHQHTDAQ